MHKNQINNKRIYIMLSIVLLFLFILFGLGLCQLGMYKLICNSIPFLILILILIYYVM